MMMVMMMVKRERLVKLAGFGCPTKKCLYALSLSFSLSTSTRIPADKKTFSHCVAPRSNLNPSPRAHRHYFSVTVPPAVNPNSSPYDPCLRPLFLTTTNPPS